jgi:hypothetical protein
MDSITWDGLDHPHEDKSPEWFLIKWIISIALALICLIFGNVLLALLTLVASATLSLLTSRPVPMRTYIVDKHGITIGSERVTYKEMLSHEFVDRGHDHLLIIDTKKVLTPHLIIPIPDDHETDVRNIFEAHGTHVKKHERGIPLSHTLMELVGL